MPEDSPSPRRRARSDVRTAVRSAVVWEVLDGLVAEQLAAAGQERTGLDVVDLGGGTGGFAVPLAELGHRVVVVDPSPDALAALQRRAAEAGVADRVRGQQGDAATLGEVVPRAGADIVLCHGVLEHVEDPAAAARAAVGVLRPGGLLSVLVAQRLGGVLAYALAGRFAEALHVLEGEEGMPRRFDQAGVLALLGGVGTVRAVHGVRLFTDLLPGALVDGDPETAQALLALERAASDHPDHPQLASLAAQLHLAIQV